MSRMSQSSLARGLGLKPGKPVLPSLGVGWGLCAKGQVLLPLGELLVRKEALAPAKIQGSEGRNLAVSPQILSIGQLSNSP